MAFKKMLKFRSGKAVYLCGINFTLNMNYLAHAYLSFSQPNLLVGNMISDFIKGKKQFDYPAGIQKGIQLHRAIDAFTDSHEATKRLKSFFQPVYRLYSGAFADVVYDYFLANDKEQFSTPDDLKNLTIETYGILEKNFDLLPEQYKKMLPYMKAQNWLFNYQHQWGIEKSFGGLVRRSTYLTESAMAFDLFRQHLHEMQMCYNDFFPGVKSLAVNFIEDISKQGFNYL